MSESDKSGKPDAPCLGKTRVVVNTTDQKYNDFKEGDTGYIDGYVRGGDNAPYVCVVLGNRVTLIQFYALTVIS